MHFLRAILIVASTFTPILALRPIPITLGPTPTPKGGGKFLIINLPGPWDLKPMPHCHPHPYINKCARRRIHRILEVLDSILPDPIPPARHIPIAGSVDRIQWVHKHLLSLVAVWDWGEAGPRRKRGDQELEFDEAFDEEEEEGKEEAEEEQEQEQEQEERWEEPTRTVEVTNTT